MSRRPLTIAIASAALLLGACGAEEKDMGSGREFGEDASTVTTNPTPNLREQRSADVVRIGIRDRSFTPAEVSVTVGQKILWTNEEDEIHDVRATGGAQFASRTLKRDQSFEYTPAKAGVIRYRCTIHAGQTGQITVARKR